MLIGNVGRDPEVRYLDGNNGAKMASFTLATTERYRDRNGEVRENTEWHNIVAWRNTAEFASKYFKKGSMAVVSGRLQIRGWTDKEGNKRRNAEVVADNIYFGEAKKSDTQASQITQPLSMLDDDDEDLPWL